MTPSSLLTMIRGMRYPGGKGACYRRLINLMPPHAAYIETHLGGGAVMRHKKPAYRNIGVEIDPAVVAQWQKSRVPCEIVQGDAVEFLRGYAFQGDELIYADPPYVPSARRRARVYRFDYTESQHRALLDTLQSLPCKVMISGYANPLYREYLRDWHLETFPAKTHVDVRQECVWLNFVPRDDLHDARYRGDTFRDRQTIKRRSERLYTRIEAMEPVDRAELIQWIQHRYGNNGGRHDASR